MWLLFPQTEIADVPACDSLNPGTLQLVSKLKVGRLLTYVLCLTCEKCDELIGKCREFDH